MSSIVGPSTSPHALSAVLLVGQPRAVSMFSQRLRFHRLLGDLGRVGERSRVDLYAVFEPQPGCDAMRTDRELQKLLRVTDTLDNTNWRPKQPPLLGRPSPVVNSTIRFLTAQEAADALAVTPHVYFHQFYKVAIAFEMATHVERERGERYRLIFRLRSDLILTWPPPGRGGAGATADDQSALSSFERAVRDWEIAPYAAWHVHDWAWLAGRNAAEGLATAWQQMQQLGLLTDGDGDARWRALAHLDWARVRRSAWALRGSNFLLCAPYPSAHLLRHPAGKGRGMLWRSYDSNATKVLAFWDALPSAIAASNANASAAAGKARAVSYLRDCWWHKRRSNGSGALPSPSLLSTRTPTTTAPESNRMPTTTLLEPEVALGLAFFQWSSRWRIELDDFPKNVVGFPAICPPGC